MALKRQVTNAQGTWEETYTVRQEETGLLDGDGKPVMRTVETIISRALIAESSAFATAQAPLRTEAATSETKRKTNLARLELLARRAARLARGLDPMPSTAAGRDALMKELCECIARLWFSERTDDVT